MQSALFSKYDCFAVAEQKKSDLVNQIRNLSDADLPKEGDAVQSAAFTEEMLSRYSLNVPILEMGNIQVDSIETQVDLRFEKDPTRLPIFDSSRPVYRKADLISIHIPYSGDGLMFSVRPSTYGSNSPTGEVDGDELVLSYRVLEDRPFDVKAAYQRNLADVQVHLDRLRAADDVLRATIVGLIAQEVAARRARLAGSSSLVASLGLPIRQKADDQPARRVTRKTQIRPPQKEWDVFISHASEDKAAIAAPLAAALKERGLRVWFDKFELTIGDSLRKKIDEGLANSRFGVVVLSPSFFGKHWPEQELNGLAAREDGGTKVILPVWHNVNKQDIAAASPTLSDRLAAQSTSGIDAVVDALLAAIAPALKH